MPRSAVLRRTAGFWALSLAVGRGYLPSSGSEVGIAPVFALYKLKHPLLDGLPDAQFLDVDKIALARSADLAGLRGTMMLQITSPGASKEEADSPDSDLPSMSPRGTDIAVGVRGLRGSLHLDRVGPELESEHGDQIQLRPCCG